MKLATRMFVVAAASMLPLAAIEAYNAYFLHNARRAELDVQAIRQAQYAASEVERILEGIWGIAKTVSRGPVIRSRQVEQCSAYLASILPDVPYITSIATTDDEGTVVCSTTFPLNSVSIADRSYFKEAFGSGNSVVGDYIIGKVNKVPLLPLATPIKDNTGKPIGVTVATLNLAWLSEHLKSRGMPPGGSVTVTDRNGVIIARQPFPEQFVGKPIPEQFQYLLQAHEPGAVELTSQDGTKRVLGYVPVPAPPIGLYVSAGLSTEQSYQALSTANWRQLAIWVLTVLASLLAASFVGKQFVQQPVERLISASRALRRGDLSVRTKMKAQDGELDLIGEEFDQTAEQLQQNNDTITTLMKELRHRGKNQIALIMSMARQLGRHAATVDDYQAALSDRLIGLAASYDLLVEAPDGNVSLKDILTGQLKIFGFEANERIQYVGPDIKFSAGSARLIGMAFHELLTNAQKHGALSVEEGRVSVEWSLKQEDRLTCRIKWREWNGPRVHEPSGSGFGRLLLQRLLPMELGGEANLSFDGSGFSWDVHFSLKEVALVTEHKASGSGCFTSRDLGAKP